MSSAGRLVGIRVALPVSLLRFSAAEKFAKSCHYLSLRCLLSVLIELFKYVRLEVNRLGGLLVDEVGGVCTLGVDSRSRRVGFDDGLDAQSPPDGNVDFGTCDNTSS
jgi:hypothetical protein